MLPEKLIVRSATGKSTVIVCGCVATPLKLTNAFGSFGACSVDHFAFSDQDPSASTFHEVPGGGVTCAQVVSARNSSTCTAGTFRPRRSTNRATDGTLLSVRSVPAVAVRMGDEDVESVGASAT